jgi:large subunit ribosomal protein L29
MKASEIRELTDQELLERIDSEKSNLVRMKLNHSISPLDNPNKITESRRTVARLKTELRSRQLKQETK